MTMQLTLKWVSANTVSPSLKGAVVNQGIYALQMKAGVNGAWLMKQPAPAYTSDRIMYNDVWVDPELVFTHGSIYFRVENIADGSISNTVVYPLPDHPAVRLPPKIEPGQTPEEAGEPIIVPEEPALPGGMPKFYAYTRLHGMVFRPFPVLAAWGFRVRDRFIGARVHEMLHPLI